MIIPRFLGVIMHAKWIGQREKGEKNVFISLFFLCFEYYYLRALIFVILN